MNAGYPMVPSMCQQSTARVSTTEEVRLSQVRAQVEEIQMQVSYAHDAANNLMLRLGSVLRLKETSVDDSTAKCPEAPLTPLAEELRGLARSVSYLRDVLCETYDRIEL